MRNVLSRTSLTKSPIVQVEYLLDKQLENVKKSADRVMHAKIFYIPECTNVRVAQERYCSLREKLMKTCHGTGKSRIFLRWQSCMETSLERGTLAITQAVQYNPVYLGAHALQNLNGCVRRETPCVRWQSHAKPFSQCGTMAMTQAVRPNDEPNSDG